MIDFHAHFGNMRREGYPQTPPLSAHQLVDRMNREGIDVAVLLPLESPEGSWGYLLTEEVIAARNAYFAAGFSLAQSTNPARSALMADSAPNAGPGFVDVMTKSTSSKGLVT